MNKRIIAAVTRWILAAGLFYFAWRVRSQGTAESFDSVPKGLYGIGAMVTAAALMMPEVTICISIPIQALFTALFFPGESDATPPVNYTLAHSYRAQERFEESIEQYTQIVHNHPEEVGAYIEGMETAFEWGAAEEAAKFCQLGIHQLQLPEERALVQNTYNALLQRFEEELKNAEEESEDEANEEIEPTASAPAETQD